MFKIMETCDKFFCYGMEKQSDEDCFFGSIIVTLMRTEKNMFQS